MTLATIQVWYGDDVDPIHEQRERWVEEMRADHERRVEVIDAQRYVTAANRRLLYRDNVTFEDTNGTCLFADLYDHHAICVIDPEFGPDLRAVGFPVDPWPTSFLQQFLAGLHDLPDEVHLALACLRDLSPALEEVLGGYDQVQKASYWLDSASAPEFASAIEHVFAGLAIPGLHQLTDNVPWEKVVRRVRAYNVIATAGLHEARENGLVRRDEPGHLWKEQALSRPPATWRRALVALDRGHQLARSNDIGGGGLTPADLNQCRLALLTAAIAASQCARS